VTVDRFGILRSQFADQRIARHIVDICCHYLIARFRESGRERFAEALCGAGYYCDLFYFKPPELPALSRNREWMSRIIATLWLANCVINGERVGMTSKIDPPLKVMLHAVISPADTPTY